MQRSVSCAASLFQVKETSAAPHRSGLEGRPPPAGDREVAESDQRPSHAADALCGTRQHQQTCGRPPGAAQGKHGRLCLVHYADDIMWFLQDGDLHDLSVRIIHTNTYLCLSAFFVVFMKIHCLTLRQQITHNAFLPSPRALCYVTTGFHRSRYWPLSSLCNSSRSDWFFILFVSGGFYIRGAEVSSGAVWFTHFIPALFLKGEIHPKTNIKLLLLTCY